MMDTLSGILIKRDVCNFVAKIGIAFTFLKNVEHGTIPSIVQVAS